MSSQEISGVLGQTKTVDVVCRWLHLREIEAQLYTLLSEREHTIEQILPKIGASERTIRKYIKGLLGIGLIDKRVLEEGRLKYAYLATPPEKILARMRQELAKAKAVPNR